LLAGMIAVISIRTVAHQTNHYRFAETAVAWMYDKPLLTYLHAWFIAFGPMIVLPLLNCNLITTFFRTHRFHLIFLVMISILGWIGGSDTERIIYYAMPIVYVQIANVLLDTMEVLKHSPILITFIILIQCVSQRIFWYLPDYPPSPHGPIHSLPAIFGNTVQFYHIPFLTILSSCGNYLDLFSFHSGLTIKALTLVQYIIVSVMLLVWMRIRDISLGHRGFVR